MVGVRITDEQHKYNIAELAPGDQATYSLSIPRRLLQADTPGVYWSAYTRSAKGRTAATWPPTAEPAPSADGPRSPRRTAARRPW